jgi:hypothetical protein
MRGVVDSRRISDGLPGFLSFCQWKMARLGEALIEDVKLKLLKTPAKHAKHASWAVTHRPSGPHLLVLKA